MPCRREPPASQAPDGLLSVCSLNNSSPNSFLCVSFVPRDKSTPQKIHRFFLPVALFILFSACCSSCVHTYFQLSQQVAVKEAAGLGNKNGFIRIMSVISIAQSAEGWLFIVEMIFFFQKWLMATKTSATCWKKSFGWLFRFQNPDLLSNCQTSSPLKPPSLPHPSPYPLTHTRTHTPPQLVSHSGNIVSLWFSDTAARQFCSTAPAFIISALCASDCCLKSCCCQTSNASDIGRRCTESGGGWLWWWRRQLGGAEAVSTLPEAPPHL